MPPTSLATSPTPAQYAKLATTLPPLLLNFLARHPPGSYTTTSSSTPTSPEPSTSLSAPTPETLTAITAARQTSNPFTPWRNPLTTRWRPPQYSLRQQASLYRLAGQHGVTSLLPQDSPKNPATKLARREEQGLRVRGTGQGQKVKGKKWERGLQTKLEAREKAMAGMAELVREWKQRGHGRGWKKWPK